MAVLKSRPKGLYKIQYPLPDIRFRFVNETNEGEIIFRDNAWIFDPPINIGTIQIGAIEVWDPEKAYISGNTYVSYAGSDVNYLPEDDPFYTEYIYRCIEDTLAGESPFLYPEKWLRTAKVNDSLTSTVHITDVYGLEETLENTVNITDLGDNFYVDPNTGKISLKIDYITVNDYTPAETIIPEEPDPEIVGSGEVKINNTIWKLCNETWTDGGEGILVPRTSNTVLADYQIYGYLYNQPAITRLLAANPGYRLPTLVDFKDSFDQFIEEGGYAPSILPIFKETSWQLSAGTDWQWDNEPLSHSLAGEEWKEIIGQITNSTGLSLVAAGGISTNPAVSLYPVRSFVGTFQGLRYWGEGGYSILGGLSASEGVLTGCMLNFYIYGEPIPDDTYTHMALRLVKDI